MEMDEEKFKVMTQKLRLLYSDEEVAGFIIWIIKSDSAKEYWTEDSKPVNHPNK